MFSDFIAWVISFWVRGFSTAVRDRGLNIDRTSSKASTGVKKISALDFVLAPEDSFPQSVKIPSQPLKLILWEKDETINRDKPRKPQGMDCTKSTRSKPPMSQLQWKWMPDSTSRKLNSYAKRLWAEASYIKHDSVTVKPLTWAQWAGKVIKDRHSRGTREVSPAHSISSLVTSIKEQVKQCHILWR